MSFCIQAPLYVEGWDEALHEVGRLSFSTVLSSKRATELLRSVEDLPVLVVGGSEGALVSLKSAQTMASELVNSVSCLPLIHFILCSQSGIYFFHNI